MSLAVPAGPSGPRAPRASGDAPASQRLAAASEFVAALSETASERGEATAGTAPARTAKATQIGVKLPRPIGGVEARASDAKPDAAAVEVMVEFATAPAEGDPRAMATPQADAPSLPLEIAAPASAPPSVSSIAMSALPTNHAHSQVLDGRDPQSVRAALAALGVDLPTRGERPASLDDIIARVNTLLPATARSAAPVQADTPLAPAAPTASELLTCVPDEILTAVKIVGQEAHFRPVGQEARRLLEMTAVAPDERLLQASLAAATQTERKGTGDRDRREQPAVAARAIDGPAATTATGEVGKDASFASVGQQIADGVQRALASSSEPAASPRSAPQIDTAAPQVFAGPVRTIKLQLNPNSLGAVTIILTHRDAELSIKLEAELAETVGKVEQDRGALTAKLAGAGYAVGELTIARMASGGGPGADAGARDSEARQGAAAQQGDGSGGRAAEQGAAASSHERGGRHGRASDAGDGLTGTQSQGPAIGQTVSGISYSGRFRPV